MATEPRFFKVSMGDVEPPLLQALIERNIASIGWTPDSDQGRTFAEIRPGDYVVVVARADWAQATGAVGRVPMFLGRLKDGVPRRLAEFAATDADLASVIKTTNEAPNHRANNQYFEWTGLALERVAEAPPRTYEPRRGGRKWSPSGLSTCWPLPDDDEKQREEFIRTLLRPYFKTWLTSGAAPDWVKRFDRLLPQEQPNETAGSTAIRDQGSESSDLLGASGTEDTVPWREVRALVARRLILGVEGHTTAETVDRNIVFEGVPGTGKTYRLKQVRDELADRPALAPLIRTLGEGRFAMTMHPATTYEDFVEGLRPGQAAAPSSTVKSAGWQYDTKRCVAVPGRVPIQRVSGQPLPSDLRWFCNDPPALSTASSADAAAFSVQDGFFVSACIEAAHYPQSTFVVLLDELNRCNLPKVMGDLLTTLESSKRARWKNDKDGYWDVSDTQIVTLPFSKRAFFVPDNVFVVGTMNTTDRSVAPLDAALRRRFAFSRCWPYDCEPDVVPQPGQGLEEQLSRAATEMVTGQIEGSINCWKQLNSALRAFGDDAMLGHSYLFDLARDLAAKANEPGAIVAHHWNVHIFPQLVEILVSNDLLDAGFHDGGSTKTTNGTALRALGLAGPGGDQYTMKVSHDTLELHWSLRGVGMLRAPIIRFKVRARGGIQQSVVVAGEPPTPSEPTPTAPTTDG